MAVLRLGMVKKALGGGQDGFGSALLQHICCSNKAPNSNKATKMLYPAVLLL